MQRSIGGDESEILSALYRAYARTGGVDSLGVLLHGIGSRIMEDLEKSVRAGLPSRKTKVEILPLDEQGVADSGDEESGNDCDFLGMNSAANDLEVDLRRALKELPSADQELLKRRYLDDQDERTIASALGISQPAVSQRLRKAAKALRRRLAEYGDRSPKI